MLYMRMANKIQSIFHSNVIISSSITSLASLSIELNFEMYLVIASRPPVLTINLCAK